MDHFQGDPGGMVVAGDMFPSPTGSDSISQPQG